MKAIQKKTSIRPACEALGDPKDTAMRADDLATFTGPQLHILINQQMTWLRFEGFSKNR